ncbi:MAG: alpha/beta hydrolase [Stellaceae bacterium]
MRQSILALVFALAAGFVLTAGDPAAAFGIDPAFPQALLGPVHAKGAVVWSHGRSIDAEDSQSPTPPYLRVLRDAGWDVLRFDRLRDGDTLTRSTERLVQHVGELKHMGYRRIVLAGQSFGAFLALMAADASNEVDAVVATAPAAYGDFDNFYPTWRMNATRLYPLLQQVRRARVMLFFFHGDDFDPGGRGVRSRAILAARGLGFAVVDQPAYLSGHWASSSGLFLRRFAGCIRDFVDAGREKGQVDCDPDWGEAPSADLRLPAELFRVKTVVPVAAAATGASAPAARPAHTAAAAPASWYGFYPNGREVLIAIEGVHGHALDAVYAIGPGIDPNEPAEWARRKGRIVGDEFVFAEKGKSTLRLNPREGGGLVAVWTAPDGKISMHAALRQIDPAALLRRTAQR